MAEAFIVRRGGGGGSGGTLVVTSSGAGAVTVSNSTLGKSYSKSVTAGGSVTFKGLKTGEWTVTLSNGTQTATRSVTVNADYSVSVAYFSATISVTYPAKSTCVVTNSSGQTVASDTNTGSSTKTWTATVGATGTYTVTATATDGSGKTKSTTVSITADGQVESIGLFYIPYLYKNGDECISLTGGWDTSGYTWGTTAFQGATKKSDSMVIQGIYDSYRGGIGTVGKVNLSAYSTLKAVGYADSNSISTVYVLTTKNAETGQVTYANFSTSETEISVDLQSVQGDYYIAIVCDSESGTKTVTVKKIWLE